MYDLPYFQEKDELVIKDFIAHHPFAFMSGCDSQGKPVATQVPVFLEEENGKRFLRGHIMRNTDHHKAMVANQNVLVVFTGPHTYVSATWYNDPHQASTWNYMSVHVTGLVRFLDDQALINVLRKTTLHFEDQNAASTTVFDNLPEQYTHRLMKAIVPFEVEIQQMENVFKLSQNRDPESYANIIGKLKERGGDAALIADEMEKRTKELFPDHTVWNGDKYAVVVKGED